MKYHLAHVFAVVLVMGLVCGCRTAPEPCPANGPCPSTEASQQKIPPRFAGGDLFTGEYKNPTARKGKRLWAASFLYSEAPKLVVEEWIGAEPDTTGKYVLLEIWNTWCPPCRRSIALLNDFHKKFGKELVVIGLCNESADTVTSCTERPDCRIAYYNGIDTNGVTRKALGVMGVPHAIVIEPGGYVIWEGFPYQEGYELTGEIIEKILAVGREEKSKP